MLLTKGKTKELGHMSAPKSFLPAPVDILLSGIESQSAR